MSSPLHPVNIFLLGVGTLVVYKVGQMIRARARTTKLPGPPALNWFFGVNKDTYSSTQDPAELYETWANEYGPVYHVPAIAGSVRIVLTDPKAMAHFFALDTYTYVHQPMSKRNLQSMVGKGLLWADGDSHKRQRRAMTAPFSNASIRNFTSIFYDSAYKVKGTWDALIESSTSGEALIDVQTWMNHVSLDSIGIAGFSHDFGSLEGKHSDMADIFEAFGTLKTSAFADMMFLLAPVIPILQKVPSARVLLRNKLHDTMRVIGDVLLQRTRSEKEMTGDYKYSPGQSVIGALIKAEHAGADLSMSEEEVRAQMNVLMVAGYETTSISMSWALLELARHPEQQEKLRAELEEFAVGDPTYDQLNNGLPYLNAVVREVLRLHAPVFESTRRVTKDDVLPLSTPVTTRSGEKVDRIVVAKGMMVTVPIRCVNRLTSIWGADAKEFVPERWIDEAGITAKAKEIQGFSHLLTFSDGARTCLGKGFAIAEFKAVLCVLIRNYKFALRDGLDTKIELHRSILRRPRVAGEKGAYLPMRVTKA